MSCQNTDTQAQVCTQDKILSNCMELLESKRNTHPSLCSMWCSYLNDNEPTMGTLDACLVAIEHMDNIPDISMAQAEFIYNILSVFYVKPSKDVT